MHVGFVRRARGNSRNHLEEKGALLVLGGASELARGDVARFTLELVQQLHSAPWVSRRLSRMGHLADGGAWHVAEVQETGSAHRSRAARRRNQDAMKVLYVDLEREWRRGQSQALVTLRWLRERGHQAELLAAKDAPLEKRAAAAGNPVHQLHRLGL